MSSTEGSITPDMPRLLMHELEEARFESGKGTNRWVLSNSSLDLLINSQSVGAELRKQFSSATMEKATLEGYAVEICRTRKKIFAILSCRWGDQPKCCKTILDLIKEGVTDSDLPFNRVDLTESDSSNERSRQRSLLCVKNHTRCSMSKHHGIKALRHWDRRDIEDFYGHQWMVLSPVFRKEDGLIPHYELDYMVFLPFKEDYERTNLSEGGYSEVWPVRICESHQNLYQLPNSQEKEPLLAIKRLKSSNAQHFEMEAKMLRELAETKHEYLVRLLATYKYDEKYHFIFPYANKNLRNFWKSIPNPRQDYDTYWWALHQMTGLASGLYMIHSFKSNMVYDPTLGNPGHSRLRPSAKIDFVVATNEQQYGRHGDLKPENILWSKEVHSKGPGGILQITDFGLGRFHRLESRSGDDPKTVGGSATYVPPEISLLQPVSRSYDIWSLGCVFLEFATWLLEGQAGLDNFTTERMERAPDGIVDDTFYSSVNNGAVVRSGVEKWIQRLRENPRCSDMLDEILQLLKKELLVVNSRSRISSQKLYEKLKRMEEKSSDSKYIFESRK